MSLNLGNEILEDAKEITNFKTDILLIVVKQL